MQIWGERERARPFKALSSILTQQSLKKKKKTISVRDPVSLCQFAPRGKLGIPS